LGGAGAGNYLWLERYARKLHFSSQVRGFDAVVPRLGQPDEYSGAFSEMEVALKLGLAGLEVSFVSPTELPGPDLTVEVYEVVFDIEVTSLNPPGEKGRATDLLSIITVAQMKKAVTGGYISRPPSHSELKTLSEKVVETIDKAVATHEILKVNMPGVALIYVAPKELASGMPGDSRGSFRFIQPYPRSNEERIGRMIRKKAKQLAADGRAGFLVIYARMIGLEGATDLYEDLADAVGAVVASFPKLTGLVVTAPITGVGAPDKEEKRTERDRTLLYSKPSVDESEATVIWRNPRARTQMPPKVVRAFEGYSAHLQDLPPFSLQ
jgi:hypothetical protein